jgi:hypothetical protein
MSFAVVVVVVVVVVVAVVDSSDILKAFYLFSCEN